MSSFKILWLMVGAMLAFLYALTVLYFLDFNLLNNLRQVPPFARLIWLGLGLWFTAFIFTLTR